MVLYLHQELSLNDFFVRLIPEDTLPMIAKESTVRLSKRKQ